MIVLMFQCVTSIGVVNLFVLLSSEPTEGRKRASFDSILPLGSHPCACHLAPQLESLSHFLAIRRGGAQVASRSEVLGDRSIRGEKPLRMARRLEPLQAPLPLAGGLMGVLRSIVQIAVLPMFDTRQDLSLCRAIAFELVRDDDPRDVL
jgi:hypothetical protein